MILTYYRIVDIATHETVADRIDNYAFAHETLEMWRRDYPHAFFEIESYQHKYHGIRPGFGRDPDLYND